MPSPNDSDKFSLTILKQAHKVIAKMPRALREEIYFGLEELEKEGNKLKEPKVRDLSDGLKELRTTSQDGVGRSFFFFHIGK